MRPLNFDQDEIAAQNKALDFATHLCHRGTDIPLTVEPAATIVCYSHSEYSRPTSLPFLKVKDNLCYNLCSVSFCLAMFPLNRFLSGSLSVHISKLILFPPLSLNFLFPLQGSDVGQGEIWLVLTDPSLQEEQPERPCKRTVALCVNTSCVLTSSVLRALNSPTASRMSFRDAIKEHGNFTVMTCLQKSGLSYLLKQITETTSGDSVLILYNLQYFTLYFI